MFSRTLITLLILVFYLSTAHSAVKTIHIGVLAHRGIDKTVDMWQATADYLNQRIPQQEFRIVPVGNDNIEELIKNKQLHFVITNPASFVSLQEKYGVTPMATLERTDAHTMFGAVIFSASKNESIKSLKDLKNKTFMAVHPKAFGGWWMAWYEFKKTGINPATFFKKLEFIDFPQDNVVFKVLNGTADAGTVRTGILESLIQQKKINQGDIRILNRNQGIYFPHISSTSLYPEWAFAKAKHTSDDLAQNIAIALFKMPATHLAAKMAEIKGWTVPLDYTPVHRLMKELKVGPYEHEPEITIQYIFEKYYNWIAAIVITIFTLIIGIAYISKLNNKLSFTNKQLAIEIRERIELTKELEFQALHDGLTGLPNRFLLAKQALQTIEKKTHNKQKFALAIIDLDHFKEINDGFGHETGDNLLKEISHRIKNKLNGNNTLARLGGDEFALLLPDIDSIETASVFLQEIILKIQEPCYFGDHPYHTSGSIGVAFFPLHGDNFSKLLRSADMAMYHAKIKGNRFTVFGTQRVER